MDDGELNTARMIEGQMALFEADVLVPDDGGGEGGGPSSLSTSVSAGTIRVLRLAADSLAMLTAAGLTFSFQELVRPVARYVVYDQILLFAAGLPAFALAAVFSGLYSARVDEHPIDEVHKVVKSIAVGMGWILVLALAVRFDDLSRLWVGMLGIAGAAVVLIERRLLRSFFQWLRDTGRLRRRIVIVGTDSHAIGLLHAYQRNSALGYDVVGFVGSDRNVERNGLRLLGDVEHLADILRAHHATGVVVSISSISSSEITSLTRRLTEQGFHVVLSSSLRDIDVSRVHPGGLDGRTLFHVEPTTAHRWRRVAKRTFDLGVATAVFIVSVPLQILIAIVIKLESPGPVVHRQARVGRNGEVFEVVRFRTTVTDPGQHGTDGSAPPSPRSGGTSLTDVSTSERINVTSVGRAIRRLSLDRLPQLACVMLGSMSIVGPRPAVPDVVAQWDEEERQRLRVLPGLTGLWRVSERSDSDCGVHTRMDLRHAERWTLTHDLQICMRTIGAVLAGREVT